LLDLDQEFRYRCFLCGSYFPSPREAEGCCKRAKAMILCSRAKAFEDERAEQRCSAIKASILGRSLG